MRALSVFASAVQNYIGGFVHYLPCWPSFAQHPRDPYAFVQLVPDLRQAGLRTTELIALRARWWQDFSLQPSADAPSFEDPAMEERKVGELGIRLFFSKEKASNEASEEDPSQSPLGVVLALIRGHYDPCHAPLKSESFPKLDSLPQVAKDLVRSVESGVLLENDKNAFYTLWEASNRLMLPYGNHYEAAWWILRTGILAARQSHRPELARKLLYYIDGPLYDLGYPCLLYTSPSPRDS